MKKITGVILLTLIVASCMKTKQIDESIQRIQVPEFDIPSSKKSDTSSESSQLKVYQHNQILNFDSSGYDTIVFREPLNSEVIYTVQKGDKIEVDEVVENRIEKKTYIKARTPSGLVGYIEIGKNPYSNGNYSYQSVIDVDGTEAKILNISENFRVRGGIFLKSIPSEISGNIHKVTPEEGEKYFAATAITGDYKWVKIELGEYEGWVSEKDLIKDKGGPLIDYPEAVISFYLIYKYEI